MSNLLDSRMILSGASSQNVHACIVGSSVRDCLMLPECGEVEHQLHIGLGPDLYQLFSSAQWVPLYCNYVSLPKGAGIHEERFRLSAKNHMRILGMVDAGPFVKVDNIVVHKSTHKTGTGFARSLLKEQPYSCDEVALDLRSGNILMSPAWLEGYNNKRIKSNLGAAVPSELVDKFKGWEVVPHTPTLSWGSSGILRAGTPISTMLPSIPTTTPVRKSGVPAFDEEIDKWLKIREMVEKDSFDV